MKVVFLGTGTSMGIPIIGCHCEVCTSTDPRNRRRRTSLHVEAAGRHILIDTSPDLREQALSCDIMRVDSVLLTHAHADHIFGFDDLRRYNTMQECSIPVYSCADTIEAMQRIFPYAVDRPGHVHGRPRASFHTVDKPFTTGAVRVDPVPVPHGGTQTLGFRLDADDCSVGYFPDCWDLPEVLLPRLEGLDVMILDALRPRPHPTHLSLDKSVELLQRIGAASSYIIHMCHELDHEATEAALPGAIKAAYDGLVLEWSADDKEGLRT